MRTDNPVDWHPESGETELARYPVSFATGTAASVEGRRSFRDRRRNDIEPELPGWPAGPTFSVRGLPGKAGVHVGTGVSGVFAVVGGILSDLLGGSTVNPEPGRGKLEERENEVDDFPVMWADAGDTARTLPWQLDPSRRPSGYSTEIVLTTRRLLVTGSGTMLWETSRESIAEATPRRFSIGQSDFRILFQDGSWVRLTTRVSDHTTELLGLLTGSHRRLSGAELSAEQQERISRFTATLPSGAAPPVLTRLPSGLVRVRSTVAGSKPGVVSESRGFVMDDAGRDATPHSGDIGQGKA
ncbi:hypothetical protein [Streptomyces sp. GQFP]|uniref:hypothetical protein n=1 Tax=Streptomyces sp. GQFP TaxID=2907545 RepID=UPI001F3A0297|nr:hypothetical protein [Streptomyces sp. GQFP]UIX31637.1 hypothetical protein LUX31_17200 [Streptomyces sp. GQFP]